MNDLLQVLDQRKPSLIVCGLVHGVVCGVVAGGQVADPVDSVYRQSQGAGVLDLVASSRREFPGSAENQGNNTHHVWEQQADGTFECVAVLPAPDSATIAVSDVNLDGAIDVITASDLDESVRVHWGTPAACAADLTGERDLNFLHISVFLSTQLDFNDNGAFNFLDISAYLQAFAVGCP